MNFSFIIPVYNVEKYLRTCVDSIRKQTFKDWEIILVDDGSPDNSPAICDQLQCEDERIRVIHKKNGGLSDARNTGLASARNEYVIFLDSDDFWQSSSDLEKLAEVIFLNPESDFIGFNCSYYYEDRNSFSNWPSYSSDTVESKDKDSIVRNLVSSGTFPMSACLKAIKREFLSKHQITFKKGIVCEDIPWFIELLDKCKSCKFINHYIYAYRQNVAGSITNSMGERTFNNLFSIVKEEIDKIEARSFSKETKDSLISFLAFNYCILLAILVKLPEGIRKRSRKELMQYKWLLKYTDNPKVKKVSLVNKLFGIHITELALRFYLNKVK